MSQACTMEVGRRATRKGTGLGRLVVCSMSQKDLGSLLGLMAEHGHKARAGGVRLALRQLNDAKKAEVADLVIGVRRECCFDTPENKEFHRNAIRVSVNLESRDSDILETLKKKYDLDSFAQVARLAIRYAVLHNKD